MVTCGVKIQKIDDSAMPKPIDRITQRTTDYHTK